MGVEFVYIPQCRIGNVLFQYIAARIFAEAQGLRLLTPFDPPNGKDIVSVAPPRDGEVVDDPVVGLTDDLPWVSAQGQGPHMVIRHGDELSSKAWPKARYRLQGWFQWSDWYHALRPRIEKFVAPSEIPAVNTRDIVVNLRIGADYRDHRWIIHPAWYISILESERFEQLHVVTDVRDEEYLAHFSRYSPVVVSSGPKGDWEYLRSFDRIICSNSTFAWWAAYFSRASRIYTFKRWNLHPVVHLGPFPGGIEQDGPFLHEV